MRIAFIVNTFPSLSQTFILNQITGLMDRGHEIDIYARTPTAQPKIHSDVETYHLYKRIHYWNALWKIKSLRFFYYAAGFLTHRRYDVMHCHFGPNALTGMELRERGILNGKLITTFHGYDLSTYIEKSGRHVYDRLFDKGELFLPVSEHMKRRLIDLGCDDKKIVLHRMGVDSKRFFFRPDRSNSDGVVRITSIARLVEKKGIEYGIRAVAKLVKSNKKVEYNIVGDGPLKAELSRIVEDFGIAPLVKFLGWKEQQEVIGILKDTDILLAPSITGKDSDQEGIPAALIEAMAMGLPVVSTRHSGIPELIEDGISGFLVPEHDVDALAERLNYLIEYPEVWPEIGRAGRVFVEKHHDIDNLNDRLVGIYNQMLIKA